MTDTTEDKVAQAVADLVRVIRPSDSWQTDVGLAVEIADLAGEIAEADQWRTFVYWSSDTINDGKGCVVQEPCRIKQTIYVDSLARLPEGELRPYQLRNRIKSEVRRALMPASARLKLNGVEVGSIRYMGAEVINELLSAGVIGIRSIAEVSFQERITPV